MTRETILAVSVVYSKILQSRFPDPDSNKDGRILFGIKFLRINILRSSFFPPIHFSGTLHPLHHFPLRTMQEIKEEDVANPRASFANPIAHTSTPYLYQDDEAHASPGAVDTQRLLSHGTPTEAASNRSNSSWGRFLQFDSLRWRNDKRRGVRLTANEEACFCEKSTGKRKWSRRCMRFGLGVLVVLYVHSMSHCSEI